MVAAAPPFPDNICLAVLVVVVAAILGCLGFQRTPPTHIYWIREREREVATA